MRKVLARLLKVMGTIAVLFFVFYLFTWYGFLEERQDVIFGVTFSTVMARQLGLAPRKVFDAIIDDLGAREIRLPIYWSEVGSEQGKFDFGDYDYFVQQAEKKGVKLILAVGRKLPRWPECHIPPWAEITNYKLQITNDLVLNYIRKTTERYKNSPAVEAWQVENEPFHAYGADCAAKKIGADIVDQEIALLRSLDSRPIVLTDSGEQGIWFSSLRRAEILGISMYSQVWNEYLGVVRFPLGPHFTI